MKLPTVDHGPRQRLLKWARAVLPHHPDAPTTRLVYQTSTMAALLSGVYDGDVTIAELLSHGDFGLGTFNHLDGEMIVIDGACHRLRSDSSASAAADDDRTPFAVVTRFQPEITIEPPPASSREQVLALIDDAVPSTNLIHAVRVVGTFDRIQLRTVMAQSRPYPCLTDVTAHEPMTELTGVRGTLAGFRTPDFEQGISVAGFHLHFIDEARTRGGHVFGFDLAQGKITLCTASEQHLSFPRTEAFLAADQSLDNVAEKVHRAEGG
jgi:acetolactate decarboxylase